MELPAPNDGEQIPAVAAQVGRDDTEKSLTDSEFCSWLAIAEPGDALEYFRGYLARDIAAQFCGLR